MIECRFNKSTAPVIHVFLSIAVAVALARCRWTRLSRARSAQPFRRCQHPLGGRHRAPPRLRASPPLPPPSPPSPREDRPTLPRADADRGPHVGDPVFYPFSQRMGASRAGDKFVTIEQISVLHGTPFATRGSSNAFLPQHVFRFFIVDGLYSEDCRSLAAYKRVATRGELKRLPFAACLSGAFPAPCR